MKRIIFLLSTFLLAASSYAGSAVTVTPQASLTYTPTWHRVEVYRAGGVVVDGITYTAGGPIKVTGSAPTWGITLPPTLQIASTVIAGTGAGEGSAAGGNNATNAAGGPGGSSGCNIADLGLANYVAFPGDVLSITIGQGGIAGTTAGGAATVGGATTVSNSTSNNHDPRLHGNSLVLCGGGQIYDGTTSVPAQGGTGISVAGGVGAQPFIGAGGGTAGSSAGTQGGAGGSNISNGLNIGFCAGGGSGGAGAVTAGKGSPICAGQLPFWTLGGTFGLAAVAVGNLGGGGFGGDTPFGLPGTPGNGGIAPGACSGYGSAGSGGGGNANGGAGCDGIIIFRMIW